MDATNETNESGNYGPAAVSNLYDQLSGLLMNTLGGSMHFGYWDGPADDHGIEMATDRMTTEVSRRVAIAQGHHILDVGCGTGKSARQIATMHSAYVTGITISNRQFELARGQTGEAGSGRVRFQLANAMDMPFPDGSFDGAFAIESILHMDDKSAALSHIARVLRPGSRLVIADVFVDEHLESDESQVIQRLCHFFQVPALLDIDDWRDLLQGAGFEIVEFADIRQNVQRTFKTMSTGLNQINLPAGNVVGENLRLVAADMSDSKGLKKLGYAIITARRTDKQCLIGTGQTPQHALA